jgi:peroxiredoxin
LADVPGRSVVFFYPWTGRPGLPNPPGWDDIPGAHGSTPEAEGFRDLYSDYATNGFGIYGVSLQPPAEQHEFAARAGLPFALLSDVENRFSGQLGLPTFEAAGTVYLKRLTMVVANGVVLRAVYPVHPPDTHAADLLDSLLC